MNINIFGTLLGILIGVPVIAFGSSFTYSLVQGQTPSEAFSTVGNQVNILFGRMDTLEAEQEELTQRIEDIEQKNPTTIDPVLDESKREPETVVEAKIFSPDEETKNICESAAEFEIENKNSLKGQVQLLCERVLGGKYETQEQYDEVVERLKEKWETLFEVEKAQNRE